MSLSTWTVRPKKVLQRCLILLPIAALLTLLGCVAYDQVRLHLADGVWCAGFSPDGTGKILYGDE